MVRLLIAFVLASCTRTSEKYCGLHPEDRAHCPPMDAPPGSRITCSADPECPAAMPHCLLQGGPTGFCVGCIDSADCTMAGRQACDPETRTCRTCVEHADCGSNACLPEGTCGTNADVVYVDANGTDAGDCTAEAKCATVAFALGKITDTRIFMKLSGTLNQSVLVNSKYVVMLADPATKLVGTTEPAFKVQKATVNIYDLEIECTTGINGFKTEMESTSVLRNVYVHGCEKGVESKGGFLGVSRSRIGENTAGGIITDAMAQFSITNSMVYRNGTAASAKGGVSIGAALTGMNRFEHNTVVDNLVKAPAAGGVTCPLTNKMELAYNIIAGNAQADTIGCVPLKSMTGDPAQFNFKSTLPPYDYHITAGSSAIDKVEISEALEDFDGEFRPLGLSKDYGADELAP